MRIFVTMTAELDETWLSEEDKVELNDRDILALVAEDVLGLLEHAEWAIRRVHEGDKAPLMFGRRHKLRIGYTLGSPTPEIDTLPPEPY